MSHPYHASRPLLSALALSLALGACSDATAPTAAAPHTSVASLPGLHGDRMATVEWSGRWPALFIQNADGSGRFQVHFENVHDKIPGNYPPEILSVTDANIIALRWPKWSPDGQQLAVVVSVAYDQSEVVVMDADGRNIRVASPNGQYMVSDVEWSPDGRYVGYLMNIGAFGPPRPELFATDLVKDEVHRITYGARFGPWDVFRFDPASQGLWYTQYEGWNGHEDGRIFSVNHATLAGVTDLTRDRRLVGNPTALSHDGGTALVTRDIDSYTRSLVRVGPGDREEATLETGDVQWARFLDSDREILLARNAPWDDPYSTPPMQFQLLPAMGRDGGRTTLSTSQSTNVVTYLRAMK